MYNSLLTFALIAAIIALLYAAYFALKMNDADAGSGRIKEIAGYIHTCTRTSLIKECRTLTVFSTIVVIVISLLINLQTAAAFMAGALFSISAGFFAVSESTKLSVRAVSSIHRPNKALSIVFSDGTVTGMAAVGLGLLGIGLFYIIFRNYDILAAFSFGASSIALFTRIGAGTYTRAAGIGTGIFEAYCSSVVSAVILGCMAYKTGEGAVYTLLLAGIGIIASIIGSIFVKINEKSNSKAVLRNGICISSLLVLIGGGILSYVLFKGYLEPFYAIASGLIAGVLIGQIVEVYTSAEYKYVKMIAKQSETGAAIIAGLAAGMYSTVLPIIFIASAILIAFYITGGTGSPEQIVRGFYGIALSAVGMMSTASLVVSVDANGSVIDNAFKTVKKAGLEESVSRITHSLDSIVSNTATVLKGLSISSTVLTTLALFAAYSQTVNLKSIDLFSPMMFVSVIIGGMIPYLFGASVIGPASKASSQMIFPGMLIITLPLVVGLIFGPSTLGGVAAGAAVTGILMALQMVNFGGAMESAKKHIEACSHDGEESVFYSAAVIGNAVGNPFRDTVGPAMNILIKLIIIVSLVFAPIFIKYGGLIEKLLK